MIDELFYSDHGPFQTYPGGGLGPDGFRMTFPNGWTISVAWGRFNACGENTAEIGIWQGSGDTEIHGHQTAEQVADMIGKVAQR